MNYPKNPNASPEIDFKPMTSEDITKLRNECDKELKKRFKAEQRKAKADMQKQAEKYGLAVTIETKK